MSRKRYAPSFDACEARLSPSSLTVTAPPEPPSLNEPPPPPPPPPSGPVGPA